ncbi:16S rRNA (cytosine(1402)-N(4))-methyltransferase RsmH [Gloeocapsa sp. PCC 73106]|uniref:16S rRNA (cytosine(1402)-N(4))-methyltransferase RsmH n=1 Tax=Gloeocapsa sp. PCC 73106 TaxID=102232 RepID=UPI0002ACBAFF|nr:16S rRNA (cytosine(1402)-N(4))-methyltransferase RsmH [Gloeocapsa sp. PCC 73106]ELR99296.1 S-adenosyl-methyltransferase MraW [Gloeocapsa sp. PCC 73106]
MEFTHIPVLSQELIAGLNVTESGHYLDATVGGGGHTRLILAAFAGVRVTAIDRDAMAIASTKSHLQAYIPHRLEFWQGNFADYQPLEKFDGIIADLGVSSPQLDVAHRGFSFRQEAPLDMRMDASQSLTSAEIINHWDEQSLVRIFFEYGEERLSRRIARRIVSLRPFKTTTELAEAIASSVPPKYRYGRIHPATRVFQALRIAVNQELTSLERFLVQSPPWLTNGGRIAIISFHSLEDRLVKHGFRDSTTLKVITKKPITAQIEELNHNPRARSAKLRIAEKIIDTSGY